MASIKPAGYKDMRNVPHKIFVCLNNNGTKVVLERYARHWRVHKTDSEYTAEYRLHSTIDSGRLNHPFYSKVENYDLNLIVSALDSGDVNELEIRNMIMTYIKEINKEIDRKVLVKICTLFDKADKMMHRADMRRNYNKHEADVSYKMMLKKYDNILYLITKDMLEKERRRVNNL